MPFLEHFAGFTNCDGWPFGGGAGEAELISAFILALLGVLFLPYPKIIENHRVNSKRFWVAGLVGATSFLAFLRSAQSKTAFNMICDTGSTDYLNALISYFPIFIFTVFAGVALGLLVRSIFWGINKLIQKSKKRLHNPTT